MICDRCRKAQATDHIATGGLVMEYLCGRCVDVHYESLARRLGVRDGPRAPRTLDVHPYLRPIPEPDEPLVWLEGLCASCLREEMVERTFPARRNGDEAGGAKICKICHSDAWSGQHDEVAERIQRNVGTWEHQCDGGYRQKLPKNWGCALCGLTFERAKELAMFPVGPVHTVKLESGWQSRSSNPIDDIRNELNRQRMKG